MNKQTIIDNNARIDALTKRLNNSTLADVRDTTATAGDVLSGKVFYSKDGVKTTGTLEAGGGSGDIGSGNYYLKVIDYDGTVLAEKRLNTGDTFTLPNSPSHDGLVFQEWSCSQEIVDGVITIADNNVMVGAVYTTASGLSEFDITLTKKTGLDVTLNMDGTKNWGDGTSDDLTTHTYTGYGDYTITCNGTKITSISVQSSLTSARLGASVTSIGSTFQSCASLTEVIIPNSITSIDNYAFQSCASLKGMVIPQGVKGVGANSFQYCRSLEAMVIPQGVTNIGQNAFKECTLTEAVIPNSVTSIGFYAFQNCSSLKGIVIPNSVASISSYAFEGCVSLKRLTISQSVTSIGSNIFKTLMALREVVIPNSVASIGSYAFQQCLALIKYDFTQHTTIPTLDNTNAFSNINVICKIYVPDDLYDEWIVATNWSTYADYIYKASEMEA